MTYHSYEILVGLLVHGAEERTNEGVNTWHLYTYKKNEINWGRISHSLLHQRVDDTLGTNRSRTLHSHLLLVAPLKCSLFAKDRLEFTQLHYNSPLFPDFSRARRKNSWNSILELLKYYISAIA